MSKWGRKKSPPSGYEIIEDTLNTLEQELREVTARPPEGLGKQQAMWPVHQINWQRSRYVYDLYYKYGRISKELYDWCVKNRIVDGSLAKQWRKPGYEKLCCMMAIDTESTQFGNVSVCRVPKSSLMSTNGEDIKFMPHPFCGCLGCASGMEGEYNIFGNKYGQRLAKIQIRREEKERQLQEFKQKQERERLQRIQEEERSSRSDSDISDSDASIPNDDDEHQFKKSKKHKRDRLKDNKKAKTKSKRSTREKDRSNEISNESDTTANEEIDHPTVNNSLKRTREEIDDGSKDSASEQEEESADDGDRKKRKKEKKKNKKKSKKKKRKKEKKKQSREDDSDDSEQDSDDSKHIVKRKDHVWLVSEKEAQELQIKDESDEEKE